jgi:catechol 2,3-dioxygenase-like lactoylglutathione lyase family enzyme
VRLVERERIGVGFRRSSRATPNGHARIDPVDVGRVQKGLTSMLTSAPVAAVIATTTLERSREFYEQQLGLTRSDEPMPGAGAVLYDCGGGTKLLVYERATAGDSEATCASFRVDDVHATVERLRGNGVVFEDYDLDEIKTENGIASLGEFKAAWFKDPDGNILAVTN